MQADALVMTDSCPTCGSTIDREKFEEIQGRLRSQERRLREALRVEIAEKHQAEVDAAVADRETQLRAELGAEAERSRSEALTRQRKLLAGECDAAKTELANVRAELEGVRSGCGPSPVEKEKWRSLPS